MTRPVVLQHVLPDAKQVAAWKHRALWYIVGWAVAGTYVVLGAGYAVGHLEPLTETPLHLLVNIEGSIRVHGFILMGLAMFFCFSLGHYSKLTWLALQASSFYSFTTSILIFLGWFFGPITWGAPWWYLLTATLSIALMVLAPDTGRKGERAVERRPSAS